MIKQGTDLIDKILHYIGKTKKDVFLVQVGAMDGESYDDVVGHIRLYDWSGLYVEPVPYYFNKMVRNKKESDLFEQSAIVENEGLVEMVMIDTVPMESGEIHRGFSGMSAIWPPRNGLGTDHDKAVLEKYGKKIKVSGITLNTLFEKHTISTFDIFLCDAEGFDWIVFNQLNLDIYRPLFIRLEHINLTTEERELIINKLEKYNYVYEITNQDIDAAPAEFWEEYSANNKSIKKYNTAAKKNLTIVTGLWDLNRPGRTIEHYLEHFSRILECEENMVVFVPKQLEEFVRARRDSKNTFIKTFELEDIKNLYSPFWDKTQAIRNSEKWLNQTGEFGWLKNSPQATLEYYNPIVMSKMFLMHDSVCWNPFNTDYFIWLDAGITQTVYEKFFTESPFFENLEKHLYPFLFLSYPYETNSEIHGFDLKGMNLMAGDDVKYVCRGGLFGGHKDVIREANGVYYSLLMNSLNQGYMGTEESIFTIMSYLQPEKYRRYALDDNGLVVKFVQNVIDDTVTLEPVPVRRKQFAPVNLDLSNTKLSLYMLTFNFPEQVRHTISTYMKHPEWLSKTRKILIDNSTNEEARIENKKICDEFNFEHIITNENLGINRGRFLAAQHFDESDSDYYIFLEDDMGIYPPTVNVCRNGLQTYVPNLLNKVQKIMKKENFDFLKLSFTEVYMDNYIQCSWYNVPQTVRTEVWPNYNKLPITGLDPDCPRTEFKKIDFFEGLLYISGDVYYANWPMIMSKEGNRKVFLDTTWHHPYEQTWMSYVFQETRKGNIRPAVLLASPICHERIAHYKPEERREN